MACAPDVSSAILTGILSLPMARTSIPYFCFISVAIFLSFGKILRR